MFCVQAVVRSNSLICHWEEIRPKNLNHKEFMKTEPWNSTAVCRRRPWQTASGGMRNDLCSKGELMLYHIRALTRSVSDDVPIPSHPKMPNNDPLEQRVMMQKFHIFTKWISICQHIEEFPVTLTTGRHGGGHCVCGTGFFNIIIFKSQ